MRPGVPQWPPVRHWTARRPIVHAVAPSAELAVNLQISRISPLQTAKVCGVLYFVMSIPLAILMALPALLFGKPVGAALIMMVVMPFGYAILGFLMTLLAAWVYNQMVAVTGGIEFSTREMAVVDTAALRFAPRTPRPPQ